MASFTFRLKQIRWHQWVIATLVLLYIVYIALSYLYLPGKLKKVTETDVATLIGRDISVDKIAYNPFTLSLAIEKLAVADQPGSPLVGWQRLFVNVSAWKSLFKWEIALDEFSIDRPEFNIEKHPDAMNFSDILERISGDGPEPPETKEPKEETRLALEIARTAINQGIFRYTDMSGDIPARSDLNDITIEVHELYLATGDLQLNPFDLSAKLPGGGDIQLSGRYRIDPLHVEANIAAVEVQLSAFSEFGENVIPVKVENGLLSFSTSVLATNETGFQIETSQGNLEITGLDLMDGTPDPPMFQAGSITVVGAALDLDGKSVSVDKVALDSILANQWIDQAGKLRYEALLMETGPEKVTEEPPAPAPETAEPWKVMVRQIGIRNSTINFSDQNEKTAQSHSLSEISLTLEDFTLTPNEPTTLSFSALLDQSGRIQAGGALIPSPFSMAFDYRLDDIRLSDFSKYVESATHLRIDDGGLFIEGSTSMDKAEGSGLTAALNLSLTGLRAVDVRTGETLLSLEAFNLENIEVDTGARNVSVSLVDLDKPEIFTQMSSEKEMNLATLSKSGNEDAPPASGDKKAETGQAAWKFAILSTGIENGAVHYTDRSVSPAFTTGIHDLSVEVGPIATDRTDPTPFSVTANIDQYAPIEVAGSLLPLDRQPGFSFTTTMEGLEMPGLSPYSVAFIGNNLKSGNLSLALDYSLKDRKLTGKNNIVAKNLYLGEKVPSETAVDAPVGLGLALLRDLGGVIDLNVGVSGDLDDPGFSVGGVIAKALLNIIVKAAASPFKLLGALVGSDEELGEIEFTRGLASLTKVSEARLKQLYEALVQRPNLAVSVQGNASQAEDGAAIKASKALQQAATARGMTPDALQTEAGDVNWWETPENRDALSSLNDALGLPPVADRSRQLQAETPELRDEALNTEVYRQAYMDIVAAQAADTAELLALADGRALAVKQHLVDVLGLDHQRVSVTKARESDFTGRTLALKIEAI